MTIESPSGSAIKLTIDPADADSYHVCVNGTVVWKHVFRR
jgi:hypothetical protein